MLAKRNSKNPSQSNARKAANIQASADPHANFHQKSSQEKQCCCCGSKKHLLPKCEKREDTPKEHWFQQTGIALQQRAAVLSTVRTKTTSSDENAPNSQPTTQSECPPQPAGQVSDGREGSAKGANVCQVTMPSSQPEKQVCLLNG